jgi:hypothetical protein
MFCGLPVSVIALPVLEMVASANRKGTAGILARSAISSSKGLPNKQTAPFSITAKARPALKTTDASSAFRLWHLLSALQIHAAKRVAHVREISLASTGHCLVVDAGLRLFSLL